MPGERIIGPENGLTLPAHIAHILLVNREIVYRSGHYAMYLGGELVGFARSYREAEISLDELLLDILIYGGVP